MMYLPSAHSRTLERLPLTTNWMRFDNPGGTAKPHSRKDVVLLEFLKHAIPHRISRDYDYCMFFHMHYEIGSSGDMTPTLSCDSSQRAECEVSHLL